jgi:protein-tyrosine phosphatase
VLRYLKLADISFVTPWLAVGGAISTESDVQEILDTGITHVVNCRVGFDDKQLLKGRTAYLWDPAPDDRKPKAASWFLEAIEFVKEALSAVDAKVLVHCTGGADRSPSIAYAILRALGYSESDARHMILAGRPQAELVYGDDAEAALRQLGQGPGVRENDVA